MMKEQNVREQIVYAIAAAICGLPPDVIAHFDIDVTQRMSGVGGDGVVSYGDKGHIVIDVTYERETEAD